MSLVTRLEINPSSVAYLTGCPQDGSRGAFCHARGAWQPPALPGDAYRPGNRDGCDRVAIIGYSVSGRDVSGAGDTPDRVDRSPRRRGLCSEAAAVDIS